MEKLFIVSTFDYSFDYDEVKIEKFVTEFVNGVILNKS